MKLDDEILAVEMFVNARGLTVTDIESVTCHEIEASLQAIPNS